MIQGRGTVELLQTGSFTTVRSKPRKEWKQCMSFDIQKRTANKEGTTKTTTGNLVIGIDSAQPICQSSHELLGGATVGKTLWHHTEKPGHTMGLKDFFNSSPTIFFDTPHFVFVISIHSCEEVHFSALV